MNSPDTPFIVVILVIGILGIVGLVFSISFFRFSISALRKGVIHYLVISEYGGPLDDQTVDGILAKVIGVLYLLPLLVLLFGCVGCLVYWAVFAFNV